MTPTHTIHHSTDGQFGEAADIPASHIAGLALDGTHPSNTRITIKRHIDEHELLTIINTHIDGLTTTHTQRTLTDNTSTISCLLQHPDQPIAVHYHHRNDSNTTLTIYTNNDQHATELAEHIHRAIGDDAESGEHELDLTFSYYSNGHTNTTKRTIDADNFDDIADNYTPDAKTALQQLTNHTPNEAAGKLILLHGPPGTGKTTAIRSIAASWADWCNTTFVIDPERLFADSDYMHNIFLGGGRRISGITLGDLTTPAATTPRSVAWKLVVIEDTDELIAGDAKARTGQALSRLLNLTDGLLGQGLKFMVMLTTNEPMSKLHPATVRPGRCLADIEIGQFNTSDAKRWLSRHQRDDLHPHINGDTSLAELYALINGDVITATAATTTNGTYL